MRILVIGGGGREHALCWRLAQSGHEVIAAPGNPGIAAVAEVVGIDMMAADAVVSLARDRAVDLVVIGPEAPLVAGVADRLRDDGFDVFGPGAAAARLEGSKKFAKEFFVRHGIPTAGYRACSTVTEADAAIDELGGQLVVKADGLAAGKGVVVCDDRDAARAAARELLASYGSSSNPGELVIEERLRGREVSMMAVTDGRDLRVLATAEDHKAVFDGDRGPNTGGMGAVSPAPWVAAELVDRVRAEVFMPTLRGLRADGLDFRGVLYAGLMITADGPRMLEYNVRFGDPETQAVLPRLEGDFGDLLSRAARGCLGPGELAWSTDVAVAVVLAAPGYPADPLLGSVITGLDAVGSEALVFHAGTRKDARGLVTSGGRVLAVVGRGADVVAARSSAYASAGRIHFDGVHMRTDIGARG